MNKLVLMSWSDSNMAGDDWTWFITLTLRKNGTYSVGAMQTSTGSPTYRMPSIYPLRSGSQVREAIESLFLDDPLASEEVDWQAISVVLSKHVPHLARELEQSLAAKNVIDGDGDLQHGGQEELYASINNWVVKAKWPCSPLSHHIGNAMDNARRRKAVFEYVRDYHSKHGRFPTARHTLHHDFSVQFPKD